MKHVWEYIDSVYMYSIASGEYLKVLDTAFKSFDTKTDVAIPCITEIKI